MFWQKEIVEKVSVYSVFSPEQTQEFIDFFNQNESLSAIRRLGEMQLTNFLGAGSYSSCYELNRTMAIKTNKHCMDYKGDGGAFWLDYCVKNYSQHLPKVYCLITKGTKFLAVTEKLKQWRMTDIIKESNYVSAVYHGADDRPIFDLCLDDIAQADRPAILEMVHHIKNSDFRKHGYRLDIHNDNIMLNENNVFVINDPVRGY